MNPKSSEKYVSGANDLSCLIKGIHSQLRLEVLAHDENHLEEIWQSHVDSRGKEGSDEYVDAMRNLAENYWTKNIDGGATRLKWIEMQIKKYFKGGKKDEFILKVNEGTPGENQNEYRVLDVGSCYNPFSTRLGPEFKVTAIDLSPDPQRHVLACDFVTVQLNLLTKVENNRVLSLARNGFDAVIFCLLLEYLPSPVLRHRVCQQAYDCLNLYGLLLIVTPDSSHQAKNQLQMKSWRLALANIGFARLAIEKLPHARCMAYVKLEPSSSLLRSDVEHLIKNLKRTHTDWERPENDSSLLFIPQDQTTKLQMEQAEMKQSSKPSKPLEDDEHSKEFFDAFVNF